MKKVLITATVQSHIAQFHNPLIELLKSQGYEVHVAARNNLGEKNGLQLKNVDKVFDVHFERNPLNKDNIRAYYTLKRILKNNRYEIIHCNTPMGGILTRLAAKKYRKIGTKVFYTAHGFHFYKGAPIKNWLVYYPIEKILALITDKLITITQEDYNLASNNFRNTDVYYIHGVGVNDDKYFEYNSDKCLQLRYENGYKETDFILLCVGELNKNKNQKTLISAINEIIPKVPNIKLLLAGNGPLENDLRNMICDLGLSDKVILLGYKTNLQDYFNLCDIVISCSFREGLPLNIMEAMLCSKPIIASINRGHCELIENNVNGYLFAPNDSLALKNKLIELIEDNNKRELFIKNSKKVVSSYTYKKVIKELYSLYFNN